MKTTYFLNKARSRIEAVFQVLLGLLLVILVSVEVLQVIGRYFFGFGFVWIQDILSILLLAIGWLGGAYLWFTRAHIVVEFIPLKSKVLTNWLNPASDLIAIAVVFCLLPAIIQAMIAYDNLYLEGLRISASVKFIPCFVGLTLIGIGASINLLEHVLAQSGHWFKKYD